MGKNSDMIAALECRQPDKAVPIWEIEFHAWEKFTKKHIALGEEFAALTTEKKRDTLKTNAEIILEVSKKLNFSAVTAPGGYWYVGPGQLAYFILPEDWRFEQVKALRSMAPGDLMIVAGSGGVMGMPGAGNYVEFAYKMYDAPHEIDEWAKQTCEKGRETAKRLVDCGADILFTASDLADNHGPFYNPEQMKRWILPYLKIFAENVKSLGVYSIIHTDGNMEPCLDGMAASGVNAFQAVDPVAGMDMRKTKDRVSGRLCLCGNVDCGLLLTGKPDDVYELTKKLLKTCKGGGGLALGASNAVQYEVPAENYTAMIETWKKHGRY